MPSFTERTRPTSAADPDLRTVIGADLLRSPCDLEDGSAYLYQVATTDLCGRGQALTVQPGSVCGTEDLDPEGPVPAVDTCVDARGVSVVDPDTAPGSASNRDFLGEVVSASAFTLGLSD